MKQYFKLLVNAACVLALVCCFSACSKKKVDTVQPAPAPTAENEDTREFVDPSEIDPALAKIFQDILFDYDKFSLKPEAQKTLKGIGQWLKSNSNRVLVEGHCDERGTNEYNLALGERRANSAKKALTDMGIPEKQISTISYGEEKPTCTEQGEKCFSKNRRDHFLLSRK